MKKRFLSLLLLGVPLLSSFAADSALPQRRPNVLLLFSDQHNPEAMGIAGHPLVKTPNLDSLARQGVRFSRAYCQDAICVPSRVSLVTGLYPRSTGVLDNGGENMLDPQADLRPLHQVLKGEGYFTAFAGKLHLGRGPLLPGWDRSATVLPLKAEPLQESYMDWVRDQGYDAQFQKDWQGGSKSDLGAHISELPDQMRDSAYTASKITAYLKEAAERKESFFCWASFHGPHQPYTPTKRWADLYPLEKIQLPANLEEPMEHLPPSFQNWRKNEKQPWNLAKAAQDHDLYRRYIAYYYAQVSEVDDAIGQILKTLESLGLRENTIVIYASDHGDFMGRHGMVEKCAVGHNVYEDTLRVPLIFAWPGHFQQNVTCESLAELVDIYATLADLLKLPRPASALPLGGRSLVPTLTEGKPTGRKYAFSENWSQSTVIGERYKLGVWQDPGPALAKRDWRSFGDMLFDRQKDPMETQNLCAKPEVAQVEKELRTALIDWQSKIPGNGRQMVSEKLQQSPNKPKPKAK